MDSRRQSERIAAIQRSVQDYLAGIEATAKVFPLGSLHLAASLIDVLARHTSERAQGGDAGQYEQFVREYLPSGYQGDDWPKQLYAGLRSVGLHNLSVGRGLALMDGQLQHATHLKRDLHGRTIVRVEEFITDLCSAVRAWEHKLQRDAALRAQVVERERRNPVFEIVMVEVPNVVGPVETTTGQLATDVFGASAIVR